MVKSDRKLLLFDDVVFCRDVESFNRFVNRYLSERSLSGDIARRTYWALFYAWKRGIGNV